MRVIDAQKLTGVVKSLCIEASCKLPHDVRDKIECFREQEEWPLAKDVLGKIIENYGMADERCAPICQDTGMACVFLEIGQGVYIEGDIAKAVDEGVRHGYSEGFLRKSIVSDPLERKNSGDNTPAMLYIDFVPGEKVRVTVAPKGFGSENMSQVKMLKPSDGVDGVIEFVVSVVEEAGPNPCPPVLVGVGLGGNFDKAALLAKKALLRPLNIKNANEYYARLEDELLKRINNLGIGPQGFGGRTTAIGVAIETMPTHIAGLPCAVNINCHVARHAAEEI